VDYGAKTAPSHPTKICHPVQTFSRIITTSDQMEALGATLAMVAPKGFIIFLSGELGAGKTTLVRGFLRRLGYTGTVKSPTYTLVEPYSLDNHIIAHFDLYRLTNAEDLEFMGARDYFLPDNICLIEWPEHGLSWLPAPDIYCTIDWQDPAERRVQFVGHSPAGQQALQLLRGC
jgi:tRNA threonylcarbamoyladenosine biosynthesis protein TsaE